MTNELMNLVQQFAGQQITNNPAVPNDKNNSTIESVAEGIMGGLKDEATGGGLGQLVNMFTSGNVSSATTQNVETSVVNTIMDKVGLQSATAKQIAAAIVPLVLNALVKKVKDPNDKTEGAGILSTLTGSKGEGIDFKALLDKGLGGADGKFDLNDALNMFGKGGSDGSSGGGLLGSLEGLLGKK